MSNRKIRVAVVGVGEVGTRAHIPAYLHNRNADLVALVDSNKTRVEKTARRFGIKRCFSSMDELFQNQDLDAISICTPPNTHAEIALKALTNGVHVLCEKPMATEVDDGKRMLEASRKQERILMIGFNLRFLPNYEKATKLVRNGRLGHVYFVECNHHSPNPLLTWSKSPWFFRPESGGGVLLDKGPHVFDLINCIFDDFPHSVSALSSTYFDAPVEDSCVCLLEYPGNRIGVGIMSWLSSTGIQSVTVHGTSQSLFLSPDLFLEKNATDIAEVSLWRKTSELLIGMKFPNFPLLQRNKVDTHQLEVDHFINQIRENKTYSPTALSGLNVLVACDAARKSMETQRKMDFVPFRKFSGVE